MASTWVVSRWFISLIWNTGPSLIDIEPSSGQSSFKWLQWVVGGWRYIIGGLLLSQVNWDFIQFLIYWLAVLERFNTSIDNIVIDWVELRTTLSFELSIREEASLVPRTFEIESTCQSSLGPSVINFIGACFGLGLFFSHPCDFCSNRSSIIFLPITFVFFVD